MHSSYLTGTTTASAAAPTATRTAYPMYDDAVQKADSSDSSPSGMYDLAKFGSEVKGDNLGSKDLIPLLLKLKTAISAGGISSPDDLLKLLTESLGLISKTDPATLTNLLTTIMGVASKAGLIDPKTLSSLAPLISLLAKK